MPGSDISRLSFGGQPKSEMASQLAREAASHEITRRINEGHLDRNDTAGVRREWKDIYRQEYYRRYAILMASDHQQIRVVEVPVDNPTARKFLGRHAIAGFNKTNCFIHVHRDFNTQSITVGKFNYPIDADISLETKEAFLEKWPGPLDRHDDIKLKRGTVDYIDTLRQHDLQRQIRYERNDEQRKVILELLTQLLHRDGSIDASGITRLLLDPGKTEINKEDGSKKPLDTLQKYLLLGKRSEAIKYAKSRKLWDHAQCLAFLDKYQPPSTGNYVKDTIKLKDDSIVQLNDEYIDSISSLDHDILKTVYRSLLNRILQSDPNSLNIVKHPNVENDAYRFAILSANDCEMEYDQTNEIFRLVNAIKSVSVYPSMSNTHLISLGLIKLENSDTAEDELLDRSIVSFKQTDTYAGRTHIISNIDLLILNEIWEYCLNLARRTCDPANYEYIIDLVPYKLVFAARLLDVGLYGMFSSYLRSIETALVRARQCHVERDAFYDWDTIEASVEYLSNLWRVFCESPHLSHYMPDTLISPPTEPIMFNPPPPASFDTSQPPVPPPTVSAFQQVGSGSANRSERLDSPSHFQAPSLPKSSESAFTLNQNFSVPPMPRAPYMGHGGASNFSQPPPAIAEEVTDFNPDPDLYEQQQEPQDYYDQQSRYQPDPYPPPPQQQQHQQQPQQQQQPPQQQQQQQPQQPQHQHQQPQQHQQQQQPIPYTQQRQQQPPPFQHQQSYNDHSNDTSRRPSLDAPPYSPPSYGQPNMSIPERNSNSMTTSSPVNNSLNRESMQQNPVIADSFGNAFSPINEYDDLPRRDSDRYNSLQNRNSSTSAARNNTNDGPSGKENRQAASSSDGDNRNPRSNDPQQPGLFANLAGSVRSLLPKSNSKPMILPDDSKPSIVYDKERGTWIDSSNPEGDDTLDLTQPPPVQAIRPPAGGYSFATKSTKNRYPKSQV